MNTTIYREVGEMYRFWIDVGQFVWTMFHAANVAIVTGIVYTILKKSIDSRKVICCSLMFVGCVVSVASALQLRTVDHVIERSLRTGLELENKVYAQPSDLGWYRKAPGASTAGPEDRIGEKPVAMYFCCVYAVVYAIFLICYWARG